MTFKYSKTIAVCIALSTMVFASSAHANNAFNKFPAEKCVHHNADNMYLTAHIHTYKLVEKPTTSKSRMKRIVKSLPVSSMNDVSYASENGSVNLVDGFNKMKPKKDKGVKMPTFVDSKAMTAR